MFENLKEKIDFEYKVFLELLKASSRTEIISRAFEIAYKEALYRRLLDSLKTNLIAEATYKYMLLSESTLDQMYLSAKSNNLLKLENGVIPDTVWENILKAVMF